MHKQGVQMKIKYPAQTVYVRNKLYGSCTNFVQTKTQLPE